MTRRITWASGLAVVVLGASFAPGAAAQSYYVSGVSPYSGGGYGGYYGGYHTSTAAEGYLRGQAALWEASGVASLYYARALSEREVARGQYIENRRAYLDYRAEQREAFAFRLQQKREEAIQRLERREQSEAQKRAAEQQEAAANLAIEWPAALADARYGPIRKEIEALAKVRMELGADAGQSSELAIRHAIRELAQQVMADEDADRLGDEQSQVVRPFVRGLAANILHATPEVSPRSIASIDAR